MKLRSLFLLLLMTGCASQHLERSLQVSASEVDGQGTLVAATVFSAGGHRLAFPRIVLDARHTEAEVFVGEDTESDSELGDGIHALILVDGGVVSVEAWQLEEGVETWRCEESATIAPLGRCSSPELRLLR